MANLVKLSVFKNITQSMTTLYAPGVPFPNYKRDCSAFFFSSGDSFWREERGRGCFTLLLQRGCSCTNEVDGKL